MKHQTTVVTKRGLFGTTYIKNWDSTAAYINVKIKFFPNLKMKLPIFYAAFQCGCYNIFKKDLNLFFAHENMKKPLSKVAHNWPKFFSLLPSVGLMSKFPILAPQKASDSQSNFGNKIPRFS